MSNAAKAPGVPGQPHLRGDPERRWNGVNRHRWAVVRLQALDRDGWRCQHPDGLVCAGRLEVHHRVRVQDGGEIYDLDNLTTRCRLHHHQHHRPPRLVGADEWTALLDDMLRPPL